MDRAGPPLHELPGYDLVAKGIEDLHHDRRTPEALLVLVGAGRLRGAGLSVPAGWPSETPAEHELYEMLAAQGSDAAHGRYNALLRRLVSFERSLARAQGR